MQVKNLQTTMEKNYVHLVGEMEAPALFDFQGIFILYRFKSSKNILLSISLGNEPVLHLHSGKWVVS